MKIFQIASALMLSPALFFFTAQAQNIITEPGAGKILKESKTATSTSLLLSNGMKVILVPNDTEPGVVYFSIVSPGGTSSYSNADYVSAENAATAIKIGGAGNFNAKDLGVFLNGKKLSVNPFIVGRSEGMNCRASIADLSTALELAHAYFTAPRKDEQAFKSFIDNNKAQLKASPTKADAVKDSITLMKANYNKRFVYQPSVERLDQINLDKCFQIFKERFADAADFTAIFTGDLNLETLKPLLEKYLASLPATHTKDGARDLGTYMVKDKTAKTFYLENATNAKVQLYYAGKFAFTKKNELMREALVNELNVRLAERLKSVDPGLKNAGIDQNTIMAGTSYYNITIEFNCTPEKVKQLSKAIQEEIEKIQKDGPVPANLEAFKKKSTGRNYEESKTMNYLKVEVLKGLTAAEIESYPALLNSITAADVKAAAVLYLSDKNKMSFVILPLLHISQ